MKVTVFKNFNVVRGNLELRQILEKIKSGHFKKDVENLRELFKQGMIDEYNEKKRSLPAFTPSGLFEGGRKLEFLKEYSGYMVLDIDKISDGQLEELKEKIIEIKYTYSCFISPSGQGLKILVKVISRPVYHKKVFNEVKEYYERELRLPIDPSGKDVTRLCFVSYDENLFLNDKSEFFSSQVYVIEEDIEYLVKIIERNRIDITDGYINWLKIGFALANAIGEEGRSYYHRIGAFYQSYDPKETDAQYTNCLKGNGNGITIATLFYIAKQYGIDLSGLKSEKQNGAARNGANGVKSKEQKEADPEDEKKEKKKRKLLINKIENYVSKHYLLRYNTVTDKLEIRKNKEIEEENKAFQEADLLKKYHFIQLSDYQENSILRELLKNNITCSSLLLRNILYSDYSNFFDPFHEYFEELPPWEGGTDYIAMLADTVHTTNQRLWHTCFRKWIVATVAAVLDYKTINHTAIILSGPQGVGKTTWLLNLCPRELNDYLYSGTINPNNKDTLINLTECMFINMDELENMNRFEIGSFKEMITKPSIRIRRAYGHHVEALPRRASFMGSVNSDQFLTDTTGSRRFLCFEIESIEYQHNIDMKMVYAQAYSLFKQGFRFYFNKEEIAEITASNEDFQVCTAEEELLVTYFESVPMSDAITLLSASEILSHIIERTHFNISHSPGAVIRVGKALKKNGFEKRKSHGIFVWGVQEKFALPGA